MAPKTLAVIYNLTARKRAFDSPVRMQAPGDRRRRPGGAQGSGTSSEFSLGFLCSGGPEQSCKFSSKNGDDTSTSWGGGSSEGHVINALTAFGPVLGHCDLSVRVCC